MPTIKVFEDLQIWKLARTLYQELGPVIYILRAKKEFRFAEQLKSSSGSVMDNIAEGFERKGRIEFVYSLGIASGETGEVKSQLYRCLDDAYIDEEIFNKLYVLSDRLGKQIGSFIIYLNKSQQKGLKYKNRINPKL
jgi:four helix bundle protein